MNTKQVEELTGMSRQNIRYYERMGLLEPARDDSNAYRDYSEEDVRRLKLIRMLRMLDMPLKDIQDIINEKVSLREAVRHQKEILQAQQRQDGRKTTGRMWTDISAAWRRWRKTAGSSPGLWTIINRWSMRSRKGNFPFIQSLRPIRRLHLRKC